MKNKKKDIQIILKFEFVLVFESKVFVFIEFDVVLSLLVAKDEDVAVFEAVVAISCKKVF